MKKSQRYQVIKKLRESKERDEAKSLGYMRELLSQEENQLSALKNYKQEYLDGDYKADGSVVNQQHFLMYRNFVHQLSHAIDSQQQKIEQVKDQIDHQVNRWKESYIDLMAMNKVIEKSVEAEKLAEDKIEQKKLDELSFRYQKNIF